MHGKANTVILVRIYVANHQIQKLNLLSEHPMCYGLATELCLVTEWPQFHHVASWEMMWASSYELEWRGALLQVGCHWWRRVT